jgi:hypothetical protein
VPESRWRALVLPLCMAAALVSGCSGLGPPTLSTLPGRELLNRIDLDARRRAMDEALDAVVAHPAFVGRVRAHLPPVTDGMADADWAHRQALLLGAVGVGRLGDDRLPAVWRVYALHARHLPHEYCVGIARGEEPSDGGLLMRQAELEMPDDGWFAFVAALRDGALAELAGSPTVPDLSTEARTQAFAMVRERMGGVVSEADWWRLLPWMAQGWGEDADTWCRHQRRFRDVVERLPEAERAVVMRVHLSRFLAVGNPYDRRPVPAAGRMAHLSDSIRSM